MERCPRDRTLYVGFEYDGARRVRRRSSGPRWDRHRSGGPRWRAIVLGTGARTDDEKHGEATGCHWKNVVCDMDRSERSAL